MWRRCRGRAPEPVCGAFATVWKDRPGAVNPRFIEMVKKILAGIRKNPDFGVATGAKAIDALPFAIR